MADKVGFVGLGNMGGPMALNLVKAGFELLVHDIAPDFVHLDSSGQGLRLPNDDVIVRIGGEPPTQFLERVGVKTVKKEIPLESNRDAVPARRVLLRRPRDPSRTCTWSCDGDDSLAEPRPDFQASPATLIFERLHLEGRSGGLSIGSPQDLKIRDQLNRGQYDTDTSQQEDDDGCSDGPIEGDKKRRNNDKADERGKENVFDVPAHDASARESARSRLFFRPVRIGYAIDASNNTIKTITIGRDASRPNHNSYVGTAPERSSAHACPKR